MPYFFVEKETLSESSGLFCFRYYFLFLGSSAGLT